MVGGTEIALVVCGAPLTSRAVDIAATLVDDGYGVSVIATPSAAEWLEEGQVTLVTGAPPRVAFRAPSTGRRGPLPSVVVVCPATFNTVNKAATGAADTFALATLCEALGARRPVLLAPMVNHRLWGHPAWEASLDVFRAAGAVFVDVRTGGPQPMPVVSGTAREVVEQFDPEWILHAVKAIAPG